jgi:hypothetical protein
MIHQPEAEGIGQSGVQLSSLAYIHTHNLHLYLG